MKTKFSVLFIMIMLFTVGCSHNMRVTNLEDTFSPPVPPPKEILKVGVKSSDDAQMERYRYISSIVDALKRSGSFEKIIYPYNHSIHKDDVDILVDLSVTPTYSGDASNFLINWPGFIIFAPAIWGYGYSADINTIANITFSENNITQQLNLPLKYNFRQAEFDRTWTEIGWLEVGVIPLIGGIAFTQYDSDVTDEFISQVAPNYGANVAKRIIEAIYTYPTATLSIKSN